MIAQVIITQLQELMNWGFAGRASARPARRDADCLLRLRSDHRRLPGRHRRAERRCYRNIKRQRLLRRRRRFGRGLLNGLGSIFGARRHVAGRAGGGGEGARSRSSAASSWSSWCCLLLCSPGLLHAVDLPSHPPAARLLVAPDQEFPPHRPDRKSASLFVRSPSRSAPRRCRWRSASPRPSCSHANASAASGRSRPDPRR